MEPRANYALIGAFVIFAAVALMSFTLWFGQNQFRESFDEYDIIFEGPVTLDDGASVRYIGIKVGEVRWVRIDRSDPSKVRTRIRIDSETPVKVDSTANIDFAGITGVTFVQINAGSASAPALERRAGQPVPVIEAERTQLEELINSSRSILGQANVTADQVNKLLTDENIDRVSITLANLESFSARLAAEEDLISNANQALISLRETSERFDRVGRQFEALGENANRRITELDETFTGLSNEASITLQDISDASAETERAANSIAEAMDASGHEALVDMRLAAQDFRRLMVRMENFVRELEHNPQALVAGDTRPYEGD
ncbi:MAG: MlaD family protein [Hyphomonadaceae bacterium]|nr:MlaD family protein [Hyphomonadaceae bacterium]